MSKIFNGHLMVFPFVDKEFRRSNCFVKKKLASNIFHTLASDNNLLLARAIKYKLILKVWLTEV